MYKPMDLESHDTNYRQLSSFATGVLGIEYLSYSYDQIDLSMVDGQVVVTTWSDCHEHEETKPLPSGWTVSDVEAILPDGDIISFVNL